MTEARILSALVEGVSELGDVLRGAAEVIAQREGQTLARWQLLSAVSSEKKTVSDLAREFGHRRQSVQRITDVLVRDQLVVYRDNPNHERSPLVGLTAQGKRLLGRLIKRQREFHRVLSRKTTKPKLAALRRGVDELREIVTGIDWKKARPKK
ncbi:MAG: helix-turn-helix domain-containing protein [Candidatus Krumholzibacteria bacterium]